MKVFWTAAYDPKMLEPMKSFPGIDEVVVDGDALGLGKLDPETLKAKTADADIIITDNEFNVEKTIIGGNTRYEA